MVNLGTTSADVAVSIGMTASGGHNHDTFFTWLVRFFLVSDYWPYVFNFVAKVDHMIHTSIPITNKCNSLSHHSKLGPMLLNLLGASFPIGILILRIISYIQPTMAEYQGRNLFVTQ